MLDGLRTDSRVGFGVAVVAAVVGLVGYTVFGWRFGGDGGGVSTVIGAVVAVVAVGLVAYELLT